MPLPFATAAHEPPGGSFSWASMVIEVKGEFGVWGFVFSSLNFGVWGVRSVWGLAFIPVDIIWIR